MIAAPASTPPLPHGGEDMGVGQTNRLMWSLKKRTFYLQNNDLHFQVWVSLLRTWESQVFPDHT